MNIADRIQQLRKANGISQEELADRVGVSRQAVSKWESEQSVPDLNKIILLSDYFGVTTDYLLKGIEPMPEQPVKGKPDARIFTVIGTALNFIGLVTAIGIWVIWYTQLSVVVGFVLMAAGCAVFAVGQLLGENTRSAARWFWLVNVWLLALMPISCVFNALDGTFGGFWWRLSPIPELGNSYITYVLCWLFYGAVCVAADRWLRKKLPKEQK
ncbi:MAG: helix-turn-helix domain-containing protein [Clostridiales bacterium]|nr:helix-turn-helix domain-containing protein [Clostridiales bacterium]